MMNIKSDRRSSRNKSIDIARGLCIIFMVLTHISSWWGRYHAIPKYTGIFFLVFFFFCSGIFYKEPTDKTAYIRKRFCRLEVPYVIVCLVVLIKSYYSGIKSIAALFLSFLYALPAGFKAPYLLFGEMTVGIGPTWFLNCLFVSNCLYLLFSGMKQPIKTLIIITLAIISSITQKYVVLPLDIQDAMIGMMFIHFGALAAPKVKRMIDWGKSQAIKPLFVFAALAVIYYIIINYFPKQWLDLGSNQYNMQSLLGTLTGFALLIIGSGILEKTGILGGLLSFIGHNSMTVLIIHALDIDCIRNWNYIGWAFVLSTFAIYIGSTYVYCEVKRTVKGLRLTKTIQRP